MSAWLVMVKTRRAPSRIIGMRGVYGLTTTAMHEMRTPHSPPPPAPRSCEEASSETRCPNTWIGCIPLADDDLDNLNFVVSVVRCCARAVPHRKSPTAQLPPGKRVRKSRTLQNPPGKRMRKKEPCGTDPTRKTCEKERAVRYRSHPANV